MTEKDEADAARLLEKMGDKGLDDAVADMDKLGDNDPEKLAKMMRELKTGLGDDSSDPFALMDTMGGGYGGKGGLASMLGADALGKGKGKGKGEDTSEKEGDADGKWFLSQEGDEFNVRIPLEKAAVKKDVHVIFKSNQLVVKVHGETIIEGKLQGSVHPEECTWSIVEKGSELQLLLCKTDTTRWSGLLFFVVACSPDKRCIRFYNSSVVRPFVCPFLSIHPSFCPSLVHQTFSGPVARPSNIFLSQTLLSLRHRWSVHSACLAKKILLFSRRRRRLRRLGIYAMRTVHDLP